MEAARLPRHLDALVETETNSDLWELVEDELILARQPFSYHNTDDCKRTTVAYADPDAIEDAGESKPNPFAVLGELKSDK